jgi:acetylornithine deacetylase/succinyl-diaminopimelate desuccinylase-like protein
MCAVMPGPDLEREVVDLTRHLVRFDTVNPPGNEEAAMRYLGTYLAQSGLTVAYEPVAPGRVNLIARLAGRERHGHLVLSGHMDVVPLGEAPWTHDPFAGGVPYGTDAMALAPYGLSAVLFGPGHPDQAHQTDEYVALSELAQAAHAYIHVARALLT